MPKIKDEIDLKELEKFGYEYEEEDNEEWYGKYLDDYEHKIFIDIKDRMIKQGKFILIFGFEEVDLDENNIQDLIQAGYVEKVQENV